MHKKSCVLNVTNLDFHPLVTARGCRANMGRSDNLERLIFYRPKNILENR